MNCGLCANPLCSGVLYASTAAIGPTAADLLTKATTKLIDAVREDPKPIVLWKMQYEQSSDPHSSQPDDQPPSAGAEHIIHFPSLPLSLSFDDEVIETAREAWQKIMGDELAEAPFMVFEDREAMANLDEDDDDSE